LAIPPCRGLEGKDKALRSIVLRCRRRPVANLAGAGELKPVDDLLPLAETIAARLKARSETIAVAESSTGGLIAAALLAVPGASAYFLGGAVAYTRQAKQLLLGIEDASLGQFRSATEPHALLLARHARARFATTWGLAETGAAGPSGNRYGDAAGHTCLAIVGTSERTLTLETGSADRIANMRAFAAAALQLLAGRLDIV
jgi:nicotinamide-nucleotide amidase